LLINRRWGTEGTKTKLNMGENAKSAIGKLIESLYLNQNLITMIVSLTALGLGEHLDLSFLTYFGVAMSAISGLSVAITTFAYTCHYCTKKFHRVEDHQ
jgi:hypothetical protein